MNVEILAVGSELLLGQIANTNAQYLSQKLSELGINVYYHTVVGDNRQRMLEALKIASSRADIIITTGGLGPTLDDLTKETVAEYLGLPLVLHQPSADAINEYFRRRNRTCTKNNLKQAMFPEKAIVLENSVGTAPGAIIEEDKNVYIILPGPPYELKPMFENYVIPYLEQKSGEKILSKVLRIYGMGESMVEEKIKDLLEKQQNPTIAPLASSGEVTLRLTVKCKRDEDPWPLIKPLEDEIRKRLGDVIYGVDEDTLESVVVDLLKKNNSTLAVAESCTGGLIANRITNVPGSSEVFLEGLTTYSNESKVKRLGVSEETLRRYGAVSSETAEEMVRGILSGSRAQIGIGVTGIAGPGGGTADKPVGLVYIGIGSKTGGVKVEKYNFHGSREQIKHSVANAALDGIRRLLINKD